MTTRTERRITLDTGVTLAFVEQGPPDSPTAVVALPGWPDPWQSFELVLDRLEPDVRALAVSQRGCGNSERPSDGYTPDDLAGDAIAFMGAVGVRSAALVGHSLGAFVALGVAIERPDLVVGLGLIGGFPTLRGTPAEDEIARAMAEIQDPIDPAFVRGVTQGVIAGDVPEAIIELLVAEGVKAPARVWRAGLAGLLEADYTPNLGRVAAPTALIWGEEDGLLPRGSQELLARLIPDSRLIAIAGVGHSPNWEAPERVAAEVAALLETTEG